MNSLSTLLNPSLCGFLSLLWKILQHFLICHYGFKPCMDSILSTKFSLSQKHQTPQLMVMLNLKGYRCYFINFIFPNNYTYFSGLLKIALLRKVYSIYYNIDLFQVYNSMISSKFSELYNCHHNPVIKHFHYFKRIAFRSFD